MYKRCIIEYLCKNQSKFSAKFCKIGGVLNSYLYCSYSKPLSKLSDTQRGKLLKAILDYVADSEEPEEGYLDAAADMAFTFIKAQIDRDSEEFYE